MKGILRLLFLLILLMGYFRALSQEHKIKVYLIHGQGSDSRLFSKLSLSNDFDTVCLNLPMPQKEDNMQSFAKKLIPLIDTTQAFVLIGVSLGGMVAAELNEVIHPKLTIIISSAKNRNELPRRYKFMQAFPIYRIFPAAFIKKSSYLMQPLVEPDRNKEKEIFKSMLQKKNKHFLKNSIPLIIKWERLENKGTAIIHIHGSSDHTIPIKHVKADIVIPKGSHMMVLTKADVISERINEIISKSN
ncbi:MAG TPA: alpha/beta hydrolase [Bacteroidia bacterium]|nr:alpha/beta hydrolase [Bacteroidia bacterium]